MLVHPHAQAAQGVGREKIQIAHDVIFTGHRGNRMRNRSRRGKIAIRAKERVVQLHDLVAHALLVGLQHLARAFIELDAVAVVGDMAARDHDGRDAVFEAEQGHGGRGNFSAMHGAIAHILRRAADGRHHPAGAGAEIAAHSHPLARALKLAKGFEILQEAFGIGVTDRIGHGCGESARAAGAKRHPAARHEFLNRDFHWFAFAV